MTMPSNAAEGTAAIADMGSPSCRAEESPVHSAAGAADAAGLAGAADAAGAAGAAGAACMADAVGAADAVAAGSAAGLRVA